MGMKLESERLLLRRYRDEDFEFLFSLVKKPEVMRHIGDGTTKNRQLALEFLYWIYRSYREHPRNGLMLLIRKEDGRRLGHAGLVEQTVDGMKELEVGYWLAPEFWGMGYAREAAAVLCREGFNEHGSNRLISLIQPGNVASRKVAEAIGMICEKELIRGGQPVLIYVLTKERWHGVSDT